MGFKQKVPRKVLQTQHLRRRKMLSKKSSGNTNSLLLKRVIIPKFSIISSSFAEKVGVSSAVNNNLNLTSGSMSIFGTSLQILQYYEIQTL